MPRPTTATLTLTAASAASSSWISLNTHQENFGVGFAIEKSGVGVAPVINVEGTMQDILVSGSVASTRAFALASAVTTSSVGTNVAGSVTFPVLALRISTISGGSGASTLRFSVIQTGKH
jgi:hypothetical protein